MAEGIFITFEGGEGSGKTTQALLVAEKIRQKGREVVITREPGGTTLGRSIRQLLLTKSEDPPTPRAELLLYAADRAHHVEMVIKPALERGAVVICDRYVDATMAYQGYGRGLDLEMVRNSCAIATGGLMPSLTLWFDLDPEVGIRRSLIREAGRENQELRFEEEEISFHLRVREGYAQIARSEAGRVRRIDARGDVGEVCEKVLKALKALAGVA